MLAKVLNKVDVSIADSENKTIEVDLDVLNFITDLNYNADNSDFGVFAVLVEKFRWSTDLSSKSQIINQKKIISDSINQMICILTRW